MKHSKNKIKKIKFMIALGADNLLRLFVYRAGIYMRLHPVIKIIPKKTTGQCFRMPEVLQENLENVEDWWTNGKLFGHINISLGNNPPEWTYNYYDRIKCTYDKIKWYKIPDFDSNTGDIKLIWELSRFDWVLALSQRTKTGDKNALFRLNKWLEDWCNKNPPYYGPNWKCGQEASIRVMHLAMASIILEQTKNSEPTLKDIIYNHLIRIAPTINYAISQDNNHGTSEAAALYIGGSWLVALGVLEAKKWYLKGKKLLENRIERLIAKDGGFSQYSVNYHRMMLDTLSMVEVWRRYMMLDDFSIRYKERVILAAKWLAAVVDGNTGDAANIGANDGAHLLQLSNTDYRDFRPSVQTAIVLYTGKKFYVKDGSWNNTLKWFKISIPEKCIISPESKIYHDTGLAILNKGYVKVLVRYPRFKFRPSHSDLLHVDLWVNGNNILRDSGTYSYNIEKIWTEYFPGTISHNTIQFDERDQMPRIGRFMFGDWIKTSFINNIEEKNESIYFSVGYRDRYGVSHNRNIILGNENMIVVDDIKGFKRKAILRWRLIPGEWEIKDNYATDGKYKLQIISDSDIDRLELVNGWESRYYFNKNIIKVFEAEISKNAKIITKISWLL